MVNLAAMLKRQISHTKFTAHRSPPPLYGYMLSNLQHYNALSLGPCHQIVNPQRPKQFAMCLHRHGRLDLNDA